MAICLIAACSKHHDDPGGERVPPRDKVTRIKTLGGNTFTYDSLGRLIRADYSNSVTARTDYKYTKDSVVQQDFDRQGNPQQSGRVIYYLGNDTLVHTMRYFLSPAVPALYFTLTYDTEKRLTEQLVGDDGSAPTSRVVNYYSAGNLDSSRLSSVASGLIAETDRYEYYTDRPNLLGEEYNGIAFGGAGSANLIKKRTMISPQADTTVIEYTYEFDADKRPVRQKSSLNGQPWGDLAISWVVF